LKLVAEIDPHLPILFLETGKHFAETLVYRDQLIKELGLTNVRNVTPIPEQIEAADRDGTLWKRDPDYCCHLRKVIPLDDALAGVDCWITGRKRHHGSERGSLQVFESVAGRVQVNPLARWSAQEVAAEFQKHDLPRHPLEAVGYRSVGCATCTFVTPKQGVARSGRWLGTAKNECGIHQARWASSCA
jgi:phosphoadenosine phosphosulfate reductase